MHRLPNGRRLARTGVVLGAAALAIVLSTGGASANVALTQVSSDPYTDSQAQHQTEVEPDTFAYGDTVVSAFQVGRVSGGGASNIGYAVSTDSGTTWNKGFLPDVTTAGGGSYGQASDASVAYDAKDGVWLISMLGISSNSVDVVTSRSTDGGATWSDPVTTATGSLDKNWITCDNTAASPHYGNCYTEYDDTSAGDSERMTTSSDGGASWGTPKAPGGRRNGLGGQPVVAPDGTVYVPYLALSGGIRSFSSTDGGASWSSTVSVSSVSHAEAAGNLREEELPTAEIDGAGTVYVAWADCRFRSGCPGNDIVLSTSSNGTTWSSPARVPIGSTDDGANYFVPGIGVDPTTSGSSARIGLTYYYYQDANCTSCQLYAGFISSTDGGATWSTATQLAGPMDLTWYPNTSQGRMFGDYISTSVLAGGNAFPILPVAAAPSGSTYAEGMDVPTGGLPVTGGGAAASHGHGTAQPATAPVPRTAH